MKSMVRYAMAVVLAALTGAVRAAESAAEAAPAADEAKEGEVREALLNGQRVKIVRENGEWYMLGRTKGGVPTNDVATVHKADDVFLRLNDEIVTWGAVDRQIEMQMNVSPLALPPTATAEDLAVVMATARNRLAKGLQESYIENALLAQEARKAGLTITPEEMAATYTRALRGIRREKRDAVLALMRDPDSFFHRNQENFLLTAKFREAFLTNGVEATAEDAALVQQAREAVIATNRAINASLRPAMETWLAELRDGSRDFAETAFDESDAPDGEDGEWGDFERDDVEEDDDWTPEMRAFAFTAPKDALGGVFETEDGYVILKVLKTNAGGEGLEGEGRRVKGEERRVKGEERRVKGEGRESEKTGLEKDLQDWKSEGRDLRAEDGRAACRRRVEGNAPYQREATEVTLARIVKEKFDVPEPLTQEEARTLAYRRKLAAKVTAAQMAALDAAALECPFPLVLRTKLPRKYNKLLNIKQNKQNTKERKKQK